MARGDGLALRDVFISMPCRCAPPENKPTGAELARCAPFMDREIALLPRARVLFALGAIAWGAAIEHFERTGAASGAGAARGARVGRPRFAHGAAVAVGAKWLVGSYHVSQQNTQTGRLTDAMMDRVIALAVEKAGASGGGGSCG